MAYVCKMANYLTIRQFSELTEIPVNTLRNWDEAGKLTPVDKTFGGTRYYVKEQAGDALLLKQASKKRKEGKKKNEEEH